MKAKEALADLSSKQHNKFIVVGRGSDIKLKTFKGSKPPETKNIIARGVVMKSGGDLALRPEDATNEAALRECRDKLQKTLKSNFLILPSSPPPPPPPAVAGSGADQPPIYNTRDGSADEAPIYNTGDGAAPQGGAEYGVAISADADGAPIYNTGDGAVPQGGAEYGVAIPADADEAPVYNTGEGADPQDGAGYGVAIPVDADDDRLSAKDEARWEKLRAYFMGDIIERYKAIERVTPGKKAEAYQQVENIHRIIRVKPPIKKKHLDMFKQGVQKFRRDFGEKLVTNADSLISGKEIDVFNQIKNQVVKFAKTLNGGPKEPDGVQYYLSVIADMARVLQRDTAGIKRTELAELIEQHNRIRDYIKSNTKPR